VIADDPLVRASLAVRLRASGVASPGEAATTAAAHLPDAILWDLGPDPDGDADLPDLDAPVVALLPDGALAAETLAAGARGVLSRDAADATLAAAVLAAAHGLVVIDARFDDALSFGRRRADASVHAELTAREHEVLQLLASGLANKEIARELGISEHTAKFHVNAILGKLGAESRTEAVVLAARLGLVIL
jgi:DNA-binding NarL/FixJ family response regulator